MAIHAAGDARADNRRMSLTLAAYVGEQVTIRYDSRDLAEIRVYHQGQYVCRAVAPDLAAAYAIVSTGQLADVLP